MFGRVQWQERAGFDDTRAGGGVEWRLGRRVLGRGALLVSPDSSRVAQADAAGELEFAVGRGQPAIGLRYLDFAGARVWIVAPSISVDLSDNVALAVRYYRSESKFQPTGRRPATTPARSSGGGRRPSGSRTRPLTPTATRASTSCLRIGSGASVPTRSPAASVSTSPSLTSFAVGVEQQWRTGGRRLTRVTFDLVQHF